MAIARYAVAVVFCLTLMSPQAADAGLLNNQTISGSLITDNGRFTCAGCDVRVELRGSRPTTSTHVDASGNFSFFGVGPGSYVLRVVIDGVEEVEQPVEIYDGGFASTSLKIMMNRRIRVERRATDSNVVDVSQYLERYPKKAVERYKRATESQKRAKTEEAIKYLEEAIAIAPDFYHAYNDLGLLYRDRGRFEDAERAFLKAHEVNKSSAEPLINLTGLYIDAEKNEQAVSTGEQAVKTNQRSAPAFFNLGMALYKISHLDRAEAALKKALQLAPKMFQVRLMLANVYMKLRNYDGLMEQLDTYLAENPNEQERRTVQEMRDKLLQARQEVK